MKWEYRIVSNPSSNALEQLGLQGWELVAVTPMYSTDYSHKEFYFKRPLN